MKKRFFTLAKFFIGWPLSLLALFFIAKFFIVQEIVLEDVLTKLNPVLLLLGMVCFVVYFFLRSYIWKLLLSEHGFSIPYRDVAFLWSATELKRYVPGNIWSFLSRAAVFSKRNIPNNVLAKSLFVEAQLMILGGLLSSLLAFPFVYSLFPELQSFAYVISFGIVTLILMTVFYVSGSRAKNLIHEKFRPLFALVLPEYPLQTNLTLLSISIISFLLYGVGTYLTFSSILFLHPKDFIGFSGFFILSFMVGYLSFITPMGLGVREGILIAGLSRISNIGVISLGAIIARISFTIGELITLLISLTWYRNQSRMIRLTERAIGDHKHLALTSVFFLLYSLYFTVASFLRFENFHTGRFDLGNMHQTVWNTAQGRIFLFTNPDGTETISRLAFHADFLLIFFTPLYFIWNDPRTLLIAQTIGIAAGAFFIYSITKYVLKSTGMATLFSFLYLMSPALQYMHL